MPKPGDIIIFSDTAYVGMGLIARGVPYRIEKHRRRGEYKFVNTATGSTVSWPASSLRYATYEVHAG